MIIVSPKCVSSITQLLEETNIRGGIIEEVTGNGKTYIEDSNGEVELLTPKFREAAYTPIKKIIETINETDFEENRKIIDKSAKEAIDKKNRLVKYIEDKYE